MLSTPFLSQSAAAAEGRMQGMLIGGLFAAFLIKAISIWFFSFLGASQNLVVNVR